MQRRPDITYGNSKAGATGLRQGAHPVPEEFYDVLPDVLCQMCQLRETRRAEIRSKTNKKKDKNYGGFDLPRSMGGHLVLSVFPMHFLFC